MFYKDVNLKEIKLYSETIKNTGTELHYLRLVYSYEDCYGNKHELTIPKLSLNVFDLEIPEIKSITTPLLCGSIDREYIEVGDLTLEKTDTTVSDENGKYYDVSNVSSVDVIASRAVKKMTLEEVEKALGYKIELISKEDI